MHYHEGMQAGENTLNALCARLVTRGVARRGGYSAEGFLEDCECGGMHASVRNRVAVRQVCSSQRRGVPGD